MGTTLATFQLEGNFPVVKDLLNRQDRLLDILRTVALSILAEIPSTPVALVESSERMRSRTCSSVHKNSSGKVVELRELRLQMLLMSWGVKAWNGMIKIAEKLVV